MTFYRERLWPSPWMYLATALVIPASLIVFLPINLVAGVVTAVVLYSACVVLMIVASPTIEVTDSVIAAGRARLPIELAGGVSVHEGEDATAERGTRLDARAWLLIRGWVAPVVKIEVIDEQDPTPYWLVSARRPRELEQAIAKAKAKLV
ncbi:MULTISPECIES: DUF3093 domain-containing protein [unclassified Salinibacterium]|uniref:DUF3093 domain-containing protein n=1 Tax=unclassified Salinibacterium TaxID=2632331 RepID=UPI0014209818|nr:MULTISPECIES: DUF3093 domain-containing protein [unclassified Salinibacterium]